MEHPHWSEVARNLFNLFRDTGLIVLLGGLIFFPGYVGQILDEAGI